MDATTAAARKSLETQMQIRHCAEQMRNTVNDLYNWEKEIKAKENKLLVESNKENHEKDNLEAETPPRSHMDHYETGPKGPGNPKKGGKAAPVSQPEKAVIEEKAKEEKKVDPQTEKLQRATELKNRGNKHVKLGEYVEAIHEYNSAIELNPDNPVLYCNRALCLLKLERYDDCIADCNQAISLDKLSVKAYYRRMQANESLGNSLEALKDCSTVLMIDAKNSEAKASLERINERLRRNAKSANAPVFSPVESDLHDILPIDKPAYKRSSKPLRRVPIQEYPFKDESKPVVPSDELPEISDEDIDKLFNSNCGPFEEVKKPRNDLPPPTSTSVAAVKAQIKAAKQKKSKGEETTKKKGATKMLDSNKEIEGSGKPQRSNVTKSEPAETNSTKPRATLHPKKVENESTAEPKIESKAEAKRETKTEPNIESKGEAQAKPKAEAKGASKAGPKTKPKAEPRAERLLASGDRPLPPPPKSTVQFYANWKELPNPQKYQYLKSIDVAQLNKILGAGFDSDTLTDVLNVLHDYYLPQKESSLAATLLEVSKNNEIRILNMLLSASEIKALNDILAFLKENPANASAIKLIAQNFNLQV